MTTRGEYDGVRVDQIARSVGEVEAVGAEDGTVVDEEPGDVDAVEYGDAELVGASDEGALNLQTGVVAGEGGPPELVGAEEALADPAVLFLYRAGTGGGRAELDG